MPGAAMLLGETAFPFRDGGLQVGDSVLRIRGRELRRNVVPEPSHAGLLVLAGLALSAALRRSRSAG
jgi:hypothetical protein